MVSFFSRPDMERVETTAHNIPLSNSRNVQKGHICCFASLLPKNIFSTPIIELPSWNALDAKFTVQLTLDTYIF